MLMKGQFAQILLLYVLINLQAAIKWKLLSLKS